MKTTLFRMIALALVCGALPASALAQAAGTSPASGPERNPFRTESTTEPAEPAVPAEEGRPAKPALTPEEEAQRSADINANYNDTLGIYEGIFERNETDTKPLDRRIETNEQMIQDYGPKLDQARQGRRATDVTFMNRMLELKRQRDSGQITEEQFRQLVADEKVLFEKKRGRYASQEEFYGGESADARKRVSTLKVERDKRQKEADARKLAKGEDPDPTAAMFDGIFGTLDQLSGFRTRFTMDDTAGLWRYDHLHGSGAVAAE